ncbi:MAG: alanine:cation symporter family protein [Proteobacteria bacterium]|nr:alanine:cation symporter family protein [Pseudomonadota bacterium]
MGSTPGAHLPSPTVDEQINQALAPASKAFSNLVFFELPIFGVGVPLVVLWLVAGAVFFTLYFRFVNLSGIPLAIRTLRGEFDEEDAPGQISHFQALATAISGTVGIGNIGGVAIAIAAGGPGATFWMIVAGFLGMATKFAECTLGVRYRTVHPDGTVSGGPMFYLRRGLEQRGWGGAGRVLGSFYAVGIMIGCLGAGNMFQANQAYVQVRAVTGGDASPIDGYGWAVGLVLALVVGGVILGGIRSIAAVTARLVPLMAGLYFVGAIAVILMNISALPAAVVAIVHGAFTGHAVAGGAIGAMVVGMQRAVFSNEAGIGSASIAHSAVRTRLPATEGLVALFEPFIDTIVICTLTALVIGVAGVTWPEFMDSGLKGVAMTSDAFRRTVWWFPYPLAVAAVLFAVSTMLSWSYYGMQGLTYLIGPSAGGQTAYKIAFCVFIVIGASIKLDAVLDFSDAMVFVLCVPNVFGLLLLAPVVSEELQKLRDHANSAAATE